jgi:glycosyltransferase involved in cell wall biosynthesis
VGATPLVVIPTYNERLALPGLLNRLHAAVPSAEVLIVDDASPDGTGEWADQAAAADPRVHVLHRAAKEGLGRAYVAAFRWALPRGYDPIVEMDADGSHRPEHLPDLLASAHDAADLVIGSRWVAGGRVVGWPLRRKILSRGGNIYVSIMLGLRVKDATAGYRVYRADLLKRLDLDLIEAHGYAFQVNMTMAARGLGARILEAPIVFPERAEGVSKMNGAIVREAMWLVTKWGLRRVATRLRLRRPPKAER